jgi:peptide/nickel transport system substrate-binding protein
VINRVNRFRAPQIESSSTAKLVRAPSGWHCDFAMNVARAPFDNSNLRLALKYAIDRDLLLKRLWNGFGRIGNDHPITVDDPFYNSELTQISRDVDKAKFYLNKSGLSNPEIVLSASNAAYEGAEEVSELFMQSANQTGINIKIRHASAHTFWDDTWMKAPFFTSYWGGRPAATQMLAVAYASDAGWNETNWRRSTFDELLRLAREELDVSKRRTCIWDMQAMIQQDGGAIIPTFADWLDAHSARVQGHTPHTHFDLCNARIAEKVSLIS